MADVWKLYAQQFMNFESTRREPIALHICGTITLIPYIVHIYPYINIYVCHSIRNLPVDNIMGERTIDICRFSDKFSLIRYVLRRRIPTFEFEVAQVFALLVLQGRRARQWEFHQQSGGQIAPNFYCIPSRWQCRSQELLLEAGRQFGVNHGSRVGFMT